MTSSAIVTEIKPLRSKFVEKSPVFYGWIILAVGIIGGIMSSPGQTYSFSIFIDKFIEDLSISRTQVSLLYSIGTFTGSLALPYIGAQIDKRGPRIMVVIIAVAFGAACIYMGFVRNTVTLLIGFIFMRMLGQNSISMVSQYVINQWWVRRRGFVLGIATLFSSTLGQGLFPLLINWLIPRYGWRGSYFILGVMVMLVMIPLGRLFFRWSPERYGLLPDGVGRAAKIKNKIKSTEKGTPTPIDDLPLLEENWTRGEALRTGAFWVILLSISTFSMLGTGLTFHMVSIFADNGLSSGMAAAVFLPMSLTISVLGIPGGWLIDRVNVKYMLSVGLVLQAITILFAASLSSPQLALLFSVIFGMTNAFARVVSNVVWANYFGRANLGAITGVAGTFGSAASGLGPLIYGFGRDLAGTYWPALWISAMLPAVMAILVLFMRQPQKRVA